MVGFGGEMLSWEVSKTYTGSSMLFLRLSRKGLAPKPLRHPRRPHRPPDPFRHPHAVDTVELDISNRSRALGATATGCSGFRPPPERPRPLLPSSCARSHAVDFGVLAGRCAAVSFALPPPTRSLKPLSLPPRAQECLCAQGLGFFFLNPQHPAPLAGCTSPGLANSSSRGPSDSRATILAFSHVISLCPLSSAYDISGPLFETFPYDFLASGAVVGRRISKVRGSVAEYRRIAGSTLRERECDMLVGGQPGADIVCGRCRKKVRYCTWGI